jgi:hypothetical protein
MNKMEAIYFSEMSSSLRSTQRHNSKIELFIVPAVRTSYPTQNKYFKFTLSVRGVRIAQSVLQQATGWKARVRFPAVQDVSLLHRLQRDSEAHPASYPMSTRGIFLRGKRSGREADRSLSSSAEVKKSGAVPLLLQLSLCHSV